MNYYFIKSEQPRCKYCSKLMDTWNPFQYTFECIDCISDRFSNKMIKEINKQLNVKHLRIQR